jgi:hypothetical protein
LYGQQPPITDAAANAAQREEPGWARERSMVDQQGSGGNRGGKTR